MPWKDKEVRRKRHAEYLKQKYQNDHEYREAHKRRVIQRNARLRAAIYEYITGIKSRNSCVVCEEKTPCCLSFHHLDPAEKRFDIAQAARLKPSLDILKEEISKCVLLCHNCHSKLHAGIISLRKRRMRATRMESRIT